MAIRPMIPCLVPLLSLVRLSCMGSLGNALRTTNLDHQLLSSLRPQSRQPLFLSEAASLRALTMLLSTLNPAVAFNPSHVTVRFPVGKPLSARLNLPVMDTNVQRLSIFHEPMTEEGKFLRNWLHSNSFSKLWLNTLAHLAKKVVDSSPKEEATLESRMREVREQAPRQRVLLDCFALGVEQSLVGVGLELLNSTGSFAPGATLPAQAITLNRSLQEFDNGEARDAVRTFVTDIFPYDRPDALGRFDRMQAAKLYMGSIQFGYFISQSFRGFQNLDPQMVLTPEKAQQLRNAIERTAYEMRGEVAWAAASRRVGVLFALQLGAPSDEGTPDWNAPLGYEQLREFSFGTTVIGSGSQSEFFQVVDRNVVDELASMSKLSSESVTTPVSDVETPMPTADNSSSGPASPESSDMDLPIADFVEFNGAGLQALLAEGCLYGWHMWGIEEVARNRIRDDFGQDLSAKIFTPVEKRSNPMGAEPLPDPE